MKIKLKNLALDHLSLYTQGGEGVLHAWAESRILIQNLPKWVGEQKESLIVCNTMPN